MSQSPAEATQKPENEPVTPEWRKLWEWLLSPDDERESDEERGQEGAA